MSDGNHCKEHREKTRTLSRRRFIGEGILALGSTAIIAASVDTFQTSGSVYRMHGLSQADDTRVGYNPHEYIMYGPRQETEIGVAAGGGLALGTGAVLVASSSEALKEIEKEGV